MQREDLENLLPAIYHGAPGSPLGALLEVAASLPQPVEDVLATVEQLFDPRRTTAEMLPFLAKWVDLDRFLVGHGIDDDQPAFVTGDGHLRELCARAAELSRERGTPKGLLNFLEVACGCKGFKVKENIDRNGQEKPFHLLINAPAQAQDYEELIHAIVAYEKPAYVTYSRKELRFL